MPLVLSLKEGDDFYVADRRVVVDRIISMTQVLVRTDAGDIHTIVDDKMTEVFPDVLISVGPGHGINAIRLVIAAPVHMKILRGSIERKDDGRWMQQNSENSV